jgi:hypothetical protein
VYAVAMGGGPAAADSSVMLAAAFGRGGGDESSVLTVGVAALLFGRLSKGMLLPRIVRFQNDMMKNG